MKGYTTTIYLNLSCFVFSIDNDEKDEVHYSRKTQPDYGFDDFSCVVMQAVEKQEPQAKPKPAPASKATAPSTAATTTTSADATPATSTTPATAATPATEGAAVAAPHIPGITNVEPPKPVAEEDKVFEDAPGFVSRINSSFQFTNVLVP